MLNKARLETLLFVLLLSSFLLAQCCRVAASTKPLTQLLEAVLSFTVKVIVAALIVSSKLFSGLMVILPVATGS